MSSNTRVLGLILLIRLTLSAVGCAAPEQTPADLNGTQWVLTSLNGESLIEETSIALYFEEAFVGGSMARNGYGGGPDSGKYVTTDDGALRFLAKSL